MTCGAGNTAVEVSGSCYCVCKNVCDFGFVDSATCACSTCYDSFGLPGTKNTLKTDFLYFF